MAEFRNRPFGGGVALGAIVAEKHAMAILRRVTGSAIKPALGQCKLRVIRVRCGFVQWAHNPRQSLSPPVFHEWIYGFPENPPLCNPGKCVMIHLGGSGYPPLVFEMTGGAGGDVRMEGTRLALKEALVVSVADDAVLRFNAFQRRMAGGAVVSEKRMRLR